jgi:hypothetical protein
MTKHGRQWLAAAGVIVMATGCSGRKSSLLLERQARGPIEEEPAVGAAVAWRLTPESSTAAKNGVEVTVRYASPEYLKELFANKAIFGQYAGKSPFYPQHMVFYVQVANKNAGKIRLSPAEFAIVDDRGNQYAPVGVDYVTAFGEALRPVASATRGVLESASPGYFGFSLPVGKLFAQKGQGQYALIQQSALQTGYLYPGVVHDGLVAFWNPPHGQRTIRLYIANIKTGFSPDDLPTATVDFQFDFAATTE